MNLESIQSELRDAGLDGWLLFDDHERAPLAYRVLGLKSPGHVSRRWYYFFPARGEPRGLVHQVEPHVLHPLPGARIPYARWQEQEAGLRKLLQDAKKVAMQYSPRCAVPDVANVDAGTVEWIHSLGVDVVSLAELIQLERQPSHPGRDPFQVRPVLPRRLRRPELGIQHQNRKVVSPLARERMSHRAIHGLIK